MIIIYHKYNIISDYNFICIKKKKFFFLNINFDSIIKKLLRFLSDIWYKHMYNACESISLILLLGEKESVIVLCQF